MATAEGDRASARVSLDRDHELMATAELGLKKGEQFIRKQMLHIANLRSAGRPTGPAEELLQTLKDCQELRKKHLELLRREIERGPKELEVIEKARMSLAESRRLLGRDNTHSPQ